MKRSQIKSNIYLDYKQLMEKNDFQVNEEQNNKKQRWNEHRITLMAYEMQYIYGKKPSQSEIIQSSREKGGNRKKNIEYEGGFLFPGRGNDKMSDINVKQLILESNCKHLKDLINNITNQDMEELKQFILLMLELKSSSVVKQFIDIYDLIVKEIKDLKFQMIKAENKRFTVIEKINKNIVDFIKSKPHIFKILGGYLGESEVSTVKFFKVTIYCFIAELHNFNINQYYADAFELNEEQKVFPTKKRKIQGN